MRSNVFTILQRRFTGVSAWQLFVKNKGPNRQDSPQPKGRLQALYQVSHSVADSQDCTTVEQTEDEPAVG